LNCRLLSMNPALQKSPTQGYCIYGHLVRVCSIYKCVCVCLCMCVCICVSAYVCVYMFVCACVYMCVCVPVYCDCVYMCVCVYMFVCMCLRACVRVCAEARGYQAWLLLFRQGLSLSLQLDHRQKASITVLSLLPAALVPYTCITLPSFTAVPGFDLRSLCFHSKCCISSTCGRI
jgi:hypothetical protein